MARNTLPISVNITAVSIKGDSVACQFNCVTQLEINTVEAVIRILDVTGEFFFPYTPVATITYTIGAGTATVVIS